MVVSGIRNMKVLTEKWEDQSRMLGRSTFRVSTKMLKAAKYEAEGVIILMNR